MQKFQHGRVRFRHPRHSAIYISKGADEAVMKWSTKNAKNNQTLTFYHYFLFYHNLCAFVGFGIYYLYISYLVDLLKVPSRRTQIKLARNW
jgi:hypothetical protein